MQKDPNDAVSHMLIKEDTPTAAEQATGTLRRRAAHGYMHAVLGHLPISKGYGIFQNWRVQSNHKKRSAPVMGNSDHETKSY